MSKLIALISALTLFSLTLLPVAVLAGGPDNSQALLGVKSGKALFDINLSVPEALPLYLAVIKETRDDLLAAGLKPEFRLAFRGAAVTLISNERSRFTVPQQQALSGIEAQLAELQKSGVQMEACAVATRLFKVDNASILPGVRVVGNTFVSAIGYQHQGFALITIQ